MKNAFISILIFSFSASYAQTGTIKGSIKDTSGKPFANGHIYINKTRKGVASNGEGKFLINNVPVGNHVVRFSAVGFAPKNEAVEVKSNETLEVSFVAEEKIETLQEVEVTGIKSITGMGYL